MKFDLRVDAGAARGIAEQMRPERLEAALVRAIRRSVGPVVEKIRAAAPVGTTSLSKGHLAGQLKRSFRLDISQRRGLRVRIVAAPHAHLVEGGHRKVVGGRATRIGRTYRNVGGVLVGKKGARYTGTVIGQVKAHPFIKPQWEASVPEVEQAISDEVVRALILAARIGKATGRGL